MGMWSWVDNDDCALGGSTWPSGPRRCGSFLLACFSGTAETAFIGAWTCGFKNLRLSACFFIKTCSPFANSWTHYS
jgi:hypothetical protein